MIPLFGEKLMMHAFSNYQKRAEDFLGILIHLLGANRFSANGTIISAKSAENGETYAA